MSSDPRIPQAGYPPPFESGGVDRWWALWVESFIRSLLDTDPHTRKSLAAIEGKVVDIVIRGSEDENEGDGAGGFRLFFEGGEVRIGGYLSKGPASPGEIDGNEAGIDPQAIDSGRKESHQGGEDADRCRSGSARHREGAKPPRYADLRILGGPFSLLRFAASKDQEEMVLGKEVILHGDTALAARLQKILSGMDIDFEELLARRIGDIPAHALMRGMHDVGERFRETGSALAADLSEYLRYEAALVARQSEGERFVQGVEDMRDDIDRLEARIALLENASAEGE